MTGNTIPEFDPADLQWALMSVTDAWHDHDRRALAALTDEQLEEQINAREALYDFVGEYRERAKLTDDQAVYHAPEWKVAAGLKDLFDAMFGAALSVRNSRESENGSEG